MFDSIASRVDQVQEVDLDALSPSELTELVLETQRLRARLEAAEARIVARWDANRCWQADGARSGGAWLAWKCRLPSGVAHQRVRHARAMRELPAVAEAWAAGEIDRNHVAALLGVRNPRTEVLFAEGHKELLDRARDGWFSHFKRSCELWSRLADADGAEQKAEQDRAARAVQLAASIDGMWFGRMTFDSVSGTIVDGTLRLFEQELFEADWAEAKQRLGREPMVFELRRTPAQRRADALVEMATRARTAPPGGRRPAPLFTVVVGLETLVGPVCELWNRTVVSPGTLAPWLAEADVERVVFGGRSRVIDVGPKRRFFRGALRRGIEVRDRTCFHPSCDEPPDRVNIDHIVEASKNGPTTQENGRLGCAFHNRRRNTHPDDWDPDPFGPDGPGADPPGG